LRLGRLLSDGLTDLRQICEQRPGALVQPAFSPGGDLCFAADWNDWWNLYLIHAAQLEIPAPLCDAQPLLAMEAELCAPQWQFGQHQYDFVDDDCLLLSINRECLWTLALLDRRSGHLTPLHSDLGSLESVFHRQGSALYCAAP